jgi:hypothetical protein
MPTAEALARLQQADQNMKAAQQAHLAFTERPGRTFSTEERAENRRLLDRIDQSIAEYWQAFEQAAQS